MRKKAAWVIKLEKYAEKIFPYGNFWFYPVAIVFLLSITWVSLWTEIFGVGLMYALYQLGHAVEPSAAQGELISSLINLLGFGIVSLAGYIIAASASDMVTYRKKEREWL